MSSMEIPIRVMLSVTTDDADTLHKSIEHFSRVLTGLAMDGVKCWLNVEQDLDEEEENG